MLAVPGLSVRSGSMANTVGTASPCCMPLANCSHAEAVTGWSTRVSRARYFATSGRAQKIRMRLGGNPDLLRISPRATAIKSTSPIDANTPTPGIQAFTFIGTNVKFTDHPGQLRAYWTATGQIIEGDVNGDGKADFSIALQDPLHQITLTSADFDPPTVAAIASVCLAAAALLPAV